RGAADCMIDVSANGDGIIRVSCSKEKDAEPWPTEEYSFEPVGSSGVLLPTDSLDDKVRKLTVREEQVLAFIGLEIFQPAGAQARQIVNALNIPERDIYRLLSHLKRELHICHDSKGDPYRLTESGKKLLCKIQSKSRSALSLVLPINSNGTATTAD